MSFVEVRPYLLHSTFALTKLYHIVHLNFANNTLEHNALELFCNQSTLLVDIESDCLGDSPEVVCPCCTGCHNDVSGEYVFDISQFCDTQKAIFPEESRGAACDCAADGGVRGYGKYSVSSNLF